jgi:hypothetical protein
MCQTMSDVYINVAKMIFVLVVTFCSLPWYTGFIANYGMYWIITSTCVLCVIFCLLCYSLSLTRVTTQWCALLTECIRTIDTKKQRSVQNGWKVPFSVFKCIEQYRESLGSILYCLVLGLCLYISFLLFTWMRFLCVVAFTVVVHVVVFNFQCKIVGVLLVSVVFVALALRVYYFW